MNVYFFLIIKSMSLSSINTRIHDKAVRHLPMCGWNAGPSLTSAQAPPPPPPQRLTLSRTHASVHSTNTLDKHTHNYEPSNKTKRQTHSSPPERDEDVEEDHVDRGIGGIEWDKLYILTYMSPETSHKVSDKSEGSNSGDEQKTERGTDLSGPENLGDKTSRGQESSSPRATNSPVPETTTPRGTTPPKEVFFNTEKPTALSTGKTRRGKTTRPSSIRRKRDAKPIPGRKTTGLSGTDPCSCTISTANNFTIYVLYVEGPRPTETRFGIQPASILPKGRKINSLDMAGFWDNSYSAAPGWRQSKAKAKVTITIQEFVKPASPYMVMLAVSGSNDLDIQCKSKSGLLKDIHGTRGQGRSTTTGKPAIPTKEKRRDQDKAYFNPYFIGGITALAVAVIFMITGLTLWRRSHANFSKERMKNKAKSVSAQRYMKTDEIYEEIPEEKRGRSGSRTKLGTLSLSVRGSHSPVLNHHDRKKDSLDRKAILTAVAQQSGSPTSHTEDGAAAHYSLPRSACDVYEELPESLEGGPEIPPPPKPFLDRESLMIQRSQSTPIRYSSNSSSDSEDDSGRRETNRRIKSSLSYSEDRTVRINRKVEELLLNKEEFVQNHVTPRATDPPLVVGQGLQRQNATLGETDSDGEDDNNDDGDENENDDNCGCRGNDANTTYVEIDCRNCLDIPGGKDVDNPTDERIPEIKFTTVYSEDHDEELVMFDNIIYNSSSSVKVIQ